MQEIQEYILAKRQAEGVIKAGLKIINHKNFSSLHPKEQKQVRQDVETCKKTVELLNMVISKKYDRLKGGVTH